MNAVEVSGLEKRFGSVRALAGIETSIPEGSVTLIRGPNGAGKSTLLRVLAGLTRPTRGEVRVLGTDPFRASGAAARGRVGYLGPEPSLYAELSIEENLSFCARLQGCSRARVAELCAALGLEEVARRPVRALSSGFRRRAGLARALLPDPALLLLDEPWNGLDAAAAALLADRLQDLRARGGTALIASHSPESHTAPFDRTLHLEHGRLLP